MPVSIIASLMLWSSLLAPASRIEPVVAVKVDRTATRASGDNSTSALCSCPLQAAGSWASLDADTEVEETGDGDPEGLASDALWLSPLHCYEGTVSPIGWNRAIVSQRTRSPILRC
jgi:hypothetical protein